MNPLNNLKIEYWYQAFLVIATVILITSLTVELKGVLNNAIQLISLSIIFICTGEWINHPKEIKFFPKSDYIPARAMAGHPRNNSILGIFFLIIGILLLSYGIYKLF